MILATTSLFSPQKSRGETAFDALHLATTIYTYIYIKSLGLAKLVYQISIKDSYHFLSSPPPLSLSLYLVPGNFEVESPVVFMTRTSSPSFARDLENIGYKRASGYINSVARLNAVYVNIYVHTHTYIQYIHI